MATVSTAALVKRGGRRRRRKKGSMVFLVVESLRMRNDGLKVWENMEGKKREFVGFGV